MAKKLWGGRFKKEMDPLLKCFSYSLRVDYELLDAELQVNEAWVRMLQKIKLLSKAECAKLVRGIHALKKQLKSKNLQKEASQYEDVHAWIQSSLEKNIGSVAKKLHTARSRNDLVVTSTRIYLKGKAADLIEKMVLAQQGLISLAEKSSKAMIPGMTHLRMAQPILFAHHLLAYVEMIEEDKERLLDARKRLDVLPLGSAALAGSSLPIDQKYLAKQLNFSRIAKNSLMAVSDRGFLTEYLSALAILWMHLSRLSEDFILWNSEAFNYIELDDSLSTGSSLMPQKKNPDVFELIRGRSGVVFGQLQALLTIQKGLPLAYNRDLQEDKPGLFDAIHKSEIALELVGKTIRTSSLNREIMALGVDEDVLYATDILEYLVRKGVPFSEAHELIGRIVSHAQKQDKPMWELTLKEWKNFHKLFDKKVYSIFEPKTSVAAKKTIGSTNPSFVKSQILRWKQSLRKKTASKKR